VNWLTPLSLYGIGDVIDNDRLILDTFSELNDSVDQMNTWWMGKCVSCEAYKVPTLDKACVPAEIVVELLSGKAAIRASASAFKQFMLLDEQGAGTSMRAPGCIVVDDDDMSPVRRVNTLKETLRSQIADITPQGGRDREKLCRRLFRSCSMSQIYRQVVTLTESDKPVVGLSFTWNRGAVSISKMNRADAYSLVQERAVEEVNSGNTESAKAANIASKTLAALPKNSTVWKRKNVAPHPCASQPTYNFT